ncbi:DinB family protein [Deinococcus sp.]|uniref:DinB family protein n=1 Tax=Deinococcus sp. TaxID=47478 RepID=UPI003B59888E
MTQTEYQDPVYEQKVAWLRAFGKTPPDVAERLERELMAYTAAAERAAPHWHTLMPERTWTPAQESEHVILVSEGSAKVAALLLSDKELRPTPQQPIEADAQGRRLAPPGTIPGEGRAWSELQPRHVAVQAALMAAARHAPEASERRFWHGAMGDLTALDWLRMAAYHTRHHRKKLEAGLSALEAGA